MDNMKNASPNFKYISSAENGKYKGWQKLITRKYRERERCFLVEGELLIMDAVLSGAELKELIVRDGADLNSELLANDIGTVACYSLSDNLFDSLSQTEHGRDAIGVFAIPDGEVSDWGEGDIVVLDRLQDPGNVGTIIRTSDAAGVAGIITIKGTVDSYSPKVVRAAAGSIFRVPIAEAENASELKAMLDKLNAKPVAIDPRASKEYFDMPEYERLAIIVGNEGGGISKEMLNLSEMNLVIPMREGIESLNAAMAFGIVIYERVRRKCKKD